jgi:hypothetical protein
VEAFMTYVESPAAHHALAMARDAGVDRATAHTA